MTTRHRLSMAISIWLLITACARPANTPADPPLKRNERAPTADEPRPRTTRRLPQQVAGYDATSEQRAEMLEQLWLTPLGKMFRHLLFENDPVKSPAEQSHEIVDRIYRDVKMTITRMSALNLMIEDLYDASRLTATAHDRITLVQTGLSMKAHVLQSTASREYFRFTPVIVGISLIAGSPLIRTRLDDVSLGVWDVLKQKMLRRDAAAATQSLRAHLAWRDLFSRAAVRGYKPWIAFRTFFSTFGYGALIYYVARTGSADAMAVQNKIWVYGLQRFVSFDEI